MGFALAVGALAGLASGAVTTLVYAFEDLFRRIPVHWMWWPAIGGLGVGLAGLLDPRILGVGYEQIHQLLRGDLVGVALLGLLVGKSVAWSFALGSGTSGGVLAPLLMMGGILGAVEAHWIPAGDSSLWALVGMAAMMSGTMRAPFASAIFALEVTHDLNVLPALLVGCIAAVAVTVLLMRRSILTEKVARRGHHIAYEYDVDPLAARTVDEVMDRNPVTIAAGMTVAELSERIARGDPEVGRRQGTPVVDGQGRLVGLITRSDVLRSLEQDPQGNTTVLEACSRELVVAYPDESVKDAVTKMLRSDVGRLPVVDRGDPRRLLGYFGRTGLLEARLRRLQEEELRDRRWGVPRVAR
jgi:CBS domain-containing protein